MAESVTVRISIVIDCLDPAALIPFWEAALDYRHVDSPPGYAALVARGGEASPTLLLQQVPEHKVGKNRVHLDVHPPDPRERVTRLEALGATRLGDWDEHLVEAAGVLWLVLQDPEGNELCVVEHV